MADLFTRKARFDLVKEDIKALEFHASRFLNGSRDALALQCYQVVQQEATKREKANS